MLARLSASSLPLSFQDIYGTLHVVVTPSANQQLVLQQTLGILKALKVSNLAVQVETEVPPAVMLRSCVDSTADLRWSTVGIRSTDRHHQARGVQQPLCQWMGRQKCLNGERHVQECNECCTGKVHQHNALLQRT